MKQVVDFNPVVDIGCGPSDVLACLEQGEKIEQVFDEGTGLPTVLIRVHYDTESGSRLESVLTLLAQGQKPAAQRAAYLVGLRKEFAPKVST